MSHNGFDITAAPGTAVRAAAGGTIAEAHSGMDDFLDSGGYGLYIVIDHGYILKGIRVYSLYAQLQSVDVRIGDRVAAGQQIGLSGSSGGARIPHLHFEFRLGTNNISNSVDPIELLPPFDFISLRQMPEVSEGFLRSSVKLYRNMFESDWNYEVRAKTIAETIFGDGTVIPAGSELQLQSRSESEATTSVIYNGAVYKYSADLLQYIYQ
jgi:hypothetical protein